MEHIAARTALVDYLVEQGYLTGREVKQAMLEVPRHKFISADPREAYLDQALIIKSTGHDVCSTISQPSIVAHMLEELEVRPGHKVLEIGTGLGYNAALLSVLTGRDGLVVTIEYDCELANGARQNLYPYKNVRVIHGDGRIGSPDNAPFDRIIATVTADDFYAAWQDQLSSDGGKILLPLELAPGVTRLLNLQRNGTKIAGHFGWPVKFVAMAGEESSGSGLRRQLLRFVQSQNLAPAEKDALLFFGLFSKGEPEEAYKEWQKLQQPYPSDFLVTSEAGPFSRVFPSFTLGLSL